MASSRLLLVCVLAALLGAPAASAAFTPGASGLGDPYYPNAGNGGYDVAHYALTLDWTPASNELRGTAVITATATQDLSRFNVDLRGFSMPRLLVNGRAAAFARDGQELVITPSAGIRAPAARCWKRPSSRVSRAPGRWSTGSGCCPHPGSLTSSVTSARTSG